MRVSAKTVAGLAALTVALAAPGARAEVLHRFALIAGNDSGGADTRPLLYAGADAGKVYDILTRLGGVRGEDARLIVDGGASDVLGALDAIGGSYFSHHLASGLLGGADKSGDGQVTLFEAYAYAYDRTVADTAESAAGAQHPTFSYDLAGNGDLVLTDVASRHEGVYIPR